VKAMPLETPEGTLVRIQRTPDSWLRSKRTKRHGRQCLLRRFIVEFLDDARRVVATGNGYVTAGDAVQEEIRRMASSRIPFHAIVSHEGTRRVHVVRTLEEGEAEAIARRSRSEREDAEWEASAPVRQ
jgi:hypothetical protein